MRTLRHLAAPIALATGLVAAGPGNAVVLAADVFWGEFPISGPVALNREANFSTTQAVQTLDTVISGVTYTATGVSQLGAQGITLRAGASLEATDAQTPFGFLAGVTGAAGYGDTVIVTSSTQSGTGSLLFRLYADGSFSSTAQAGHFTRANAILGVCGNIGCLDSSDPTLSTVNIGSLTGSGSSAVPNTLFDVGVLDFTYNQPVDFTFYLLTNSLFARNPNSGAFSVSANFLDTATLAPIVVFDNAGNRDFSAVIRSTTAAITYDTAVPEPSTWALLILGFGCIGALLRCRRQVALF